MRSAFQFICLLTFPVAISLLSPLSGAEVAKPTPGSFVSVADTLTRRSGERLQQLVPEAPAPVRLTAAARFADDLVRQQPSLSDEREAQGFSFAGLDSRLFQAVARELKGAESESLRDELALRRLEAALALLDGKPGVRAEADRVLQAFRTTSSVYAKRLREGRMDDDDLLAMVRKVRSGPADAKRVVERSRADPASDIITEFSKRNQNGAAVARLRGYIVECELKTATGSSQQLVIARLRPDYFRLHAYDDGRLNLILAGTREALQRWPRGGRVSSAKQEDPETASFLSNFIEPLFDSERLTLRSEGEGKIGERPAFKLSVDDPLNGRNTVWIDKENYRLLQRDLADGSKMKYSEFRDEAGISWPHRIETLDGKGRSSVLTIKRVTANPGLVSELFQLTETPAFDVFALDGLLAQGIDARPTPAR
ncbi:hypothetical protein [Nibricoccus sp. IMCC34717]|uniref:hypothetical protein n=1 Tax=Nibricoccus sp. IMCC34717 TaxID=3034021 RepID=UPI00384EAE4F